MIAAVEVFCGMQRDAAVSGSRQRSRQRCEAASIRVSEYTADLYNLVPRLVRTLFPGAPPLHGGGQGFESPRLHSRKLDICR